MTWRQEVLFPGLDPVWTNAPPGQRLCVGCGRYRPEAEVDAWLARCAACREARLTDPTRVYMDLPADCGSVQCCMCGRAFVPSRQAWREAQKAGHTLDNHPWCCSMVCVGRRGGSAPKKRKSFVTGPSSLAKDKGQRTKDHGQKRRH